jgi:hypothetical protein
VYAIRDIGLAIAFPLWNANSLLGIAYGALLFNELRGAARGMWVRVVGGTVAMLVGGTRARRLERRRPPGHRRGARRGRGTRGRRDVGDDVRALSQGVPHRHVAAGVHHLLHGGRDRHDDDARALADRRRRTLGRALDAARPVLFFLFAGGFVWVIGDLFQQYAAKYIGISRGIPLSNTNQLWGLAWGVLVFGELRTASAPLGAVVAGSLLMAAGAAAIALAAPDEAEQARWAEAADREATRYGVDRAWVRARLAGESGETRTFRRRPVDWAIALAATAVFVWLAAEARAPELRVALGGAAGLAALSVVLLAVAGTLVWRATRFR